MKKTKVDTEAASKSISKAIAALDADEGPSQATLVSVLKENESLFRLAQERGKTSYEVAKILTASGLNVSASTVRAAAKAAGFAFGATPAPTKPRQPRKPKHKTQPTTDSTPAPRFSLGPRPRPEEARPVTINDETNDKKATPDEGRFPEEYLP